ncbi:YdbL family protein [Thalassolituus marinus]|uniref:YdbL family protein n=1 Tax=Thalassolituus marinus TaxID=671053 RepID=A0ABS7ZPJ3_9GAMM|nr:YdbL family protein [Thalassolituus marinus]MCA6062401.1 YdbL family protein [Thalassolituus marinus]
MKKVTLMIAALLVSVSSWALELDAAKQMGLVGEQMNGYLGLVASSNSEAAALVVEINQQRKLKYQEIAAKQNTALANIEKIAGEKLTAKAAAAGEYHQSSAGSWNR